MKMPHLSGSAWQAAHPPETRRGGADGWAPALAKRLATSTPWTPERQKECRARSRERRRAEGYRPPRPTPEYRAWVDAKHRVSNPRCSAWADYGGRGITMAPEWVDDFAAFLAHIGPRPDGASLDRIDNDRGYEPGNVRWASLAEQNRNRRPRTVVLAARDRVTSVSTHPTI